MDTYRRTINVFFWSRLPSVHGISVADFFYGSEIQRNGSWCGSESDPGVQNSPYVRTNGQLWSHLLWSELRFWSITKSGWGKPKIPNLSGTTYSRLLTSVTDPWHFGVDLTNRSVSCYFRHWPSRCQQSTNYFLLISLWRYIYTIVQRYKSLKKVLKNSRSQGFFKLFLHD